MLRPSIVDQAVALADSLGFKNSCLDEVGELLRLLAGHINHGIIAEIGTGFGVGTAWLASGTTRELYTIDHDRDRVIKTTELFAEVPSVHIMCGNWDEIIQHGPFQLIFVDAKPAKLKGVDAVVNATQVGGLIVLDDLTPMEFWSDEWKANSDPVRNAWLCHHQLISVEIRTSLKASAILARRVS